MSRIKNVAKFSLKVYLAHQLYSFLYGCVLGIRYQIKNGAGNAPSKQEIANHYFGIKKCV
jgi:hypothetical protein